ncbi:NAD(P)-dependent oxidoreductase [Telmatospirillum sp.]|uniref:NAD(P)-dependent oxidoreductase n=1 Tax=Telmatospirillum sp. TaxID=2079197 RepID=UPI00283D87B0|nr:NAD(P)-dependent oxidoreductase [Telmatospirillum sp.]MDR3435395.1 NAD(P)-dependent oxidoreductase [Telmatospirillum sp.]
MSEAKAKIGWIGLGHMGLPMSRNLLAAGYPVTIYNRTRAKAMELGCPVADTPAALVADADIIITMVSDDASQEEILFGAHGVAEGISAGKTVINMGTISPGASRAHAERLKAKGVDVLDAPVSGSVKPATDGTLVILVGGETKTFERCKPIFEVLGKRTFHFGDHGQGANAKLAINMMLGLTLQALAESVVLGTKSGLDADMLLDMISEAAVASPIIAMKTPSIRAGKFPAAFPLKHMEKDFRLAVDAAKAVGAAVPITEAATKTFSQAKANGLGDSDIMAVLAQLQSMSALR